MSLTALLGATDFNSYLSVAEGDALGAQALGDNSWNNTTEEIDKEKALVNATKWLDTLDFVGTKCDPSQPLKWPRANAVCGDYNYGCNDMPKEVEYSTFQLACILLGDPTFISGSNPGNDPSSGGGVPGQLIPGINNSDTSKISLGKGELLVEFKDDVSDGDGNLMSKVPVLSQLLGCLTTTVGAVGDSRVLLRVRS